jgi:hypothetical protein
MKSQSILAPLVVWGCLASPDAFCAGAERVPLVLENQALRLEIHPTPTPCVGRLVHKRSGMAVVADPAFADLFQVVLSDEDGHLRTVESSRARQTSAALAGSGPAANAVMNWSKFPGTDLEVQVAAAPHEDEPVVHWSIRVTNRTGRRIASVRFPMVQAVRSLGQAKDDVLVLPALPGALVKNPAGTWPVGQGVTLSYPGSLSAQFLSYQDGTAGLYLASEDSQGHPQALAVARRADGFLLYHEFERIGGTRREWESPYPVAVGVAQGTWWDTADQYKRWAVKQPWCAKRLDQRDDIPAWWKQGPAVHVCEVRTYDERGVCDGSYYPKLLDHLRAFRSKIQGPVVAMLAGWENHRRWTAGDYFPIFDEPRALRVIARMRQEGIRPLFFLSGLYYSFRNVGVDGGEIPSAEKLLPYFVIDERSKKPKATTSDESHGDVLWKRQMYEFCVQPSFTRDFYCGLIDQAHARGVNLLQMDQTTQGAGSACYAAGHGHRPGPGLYQAQSFQDLLQRMRRFGKKRDPEFALFHEEPHEELIPYVDGFHVREYSENRWYRSYPGAVGIPLFSYLYHEYALGYGGDSAGLGPADDRRLVRAHAVNLVTGRTPGAAVWSSPQNVAQAHPDQIEILRTHCRLLKTPAREFLLLGRMLHPLPLEVPALTYSFPGDDDRAPPRKLEEPGVLSSSWQSPAGRVGHLFVNLCRSKVKLKVSLDTRNAPSWPAADAEIYTSGDPTGFHSLWKAARLPKALVKELAPLETVFVDLHPAL